MNVVICDDEQIYLQSASKKIGDWANEHRVSNAVLVRTFRSSEDLLDAWENGLHIDMLFIDIQIPGEMSGMDVAKQIFKSDNTVPIAFITNYSEYACDGYAVNALRYIMKPFLPSAIAECMDIAWNRWRLMQTEGITIKTGKQTYILPYKDIISFEARGHYVTVTSVRNPAIEYRTSFNTIMTSLPSGLFGQCHRSYIVNIMYVRRLQPDSILLADEREIPIGSKFSNSFFALFENYYQGGEIK